MNKDCHLSGERGSSETLEHNVKPLGEAGALSDMKWNGMAYEWYEFEMGDHHSLYLNQSLFFNHDCMIGFDDDFLTFSSLCSNCLNLTVGNAW